MLILLIKTSGKKCEAAFQNRHSVIDQEKNETAEKQNYEGKAKTVLRTKETGLSGVTYQIHNNISGHMTISRFYVIFTVHF
jgi:hypothetical protein